MSSTTMAVEHTIGKGGAVTVAPQRPKAVADALDRDKARDRVADRKDQPPREERQEKEVAGQQTPAINALM